MKTKEAQPDANVLLFYRSLARPAKDPGAPPKLCLPPRGPVRHERGLLSRPGRASFGDTQSFVGL